MSIKDFIQKIKSYTANIKDSVYSQEKGLKIRDDLYIVLIIVLVGTASYGLGKISAFEKAKTPISIIKTRDYMYSTALESTLPKAELNTTQTQTNGLVMASKSGTKYYYPWCTGASRIKDENKVWFNTIEEAKSAGLTPASNCTGLK